LPLAEFTPARSALAKRLGPTGVSVRALEKPVLAAWAVNQLFWGKRAVFDRLIAAARARRAEHGRLLSGKKADVDSAERAHAAALRAASDEVRAILASTGSEGSAVTLDAAIETLQALPGSARPGRLTKPLKLAGFEALAGLVPSNARARRALSPAHPPAPQPVPGEKPVAAAVAAKREADAKKRQDAARRQQVAETQKALKDVRVERKRADAELHSQRRALDRAKDERERLQNQLQFAAKKIEAAAAAVRRLEQRAAQATQESARLEAKLAELNKAPAGAPTTMAARHTRPADRGAGGPAVPVSQIDRPAKRPV
jgi:uncharacterized protein YhaN